MKFLKYFGFLVLTIVLLFVFIINFSSVESRFQCTGEITKNGESKPATIFMKLEEYRWWVGLWSKSEGRVWIELPNTTTEYYGHVKKVEHQYMIYYRPDKFMGIYSTLSNKLFLETSYGLFDGNCKRIER